MIAIHSALYIFKPRVANGEGGLYPYRKIAYAIWLVVPLLISSLAFINNGDSYVNDGTYCYLPVRPFWYRLALGWVPRYAIFLIILGIYASIYYYVRYKFHGFAKASRNQNDGAGDSSEDSNKSIRRPKLPGLPHTPELHCHGLIPDSRHGSALSEPEGQMNPLPTTEMATSLPLGSPGSAHRFMWENLIAAKDLNNTLASSPDVSSGESDSTTGPATLRSLPLLKTSFPISPHDGAADSIDPTHLKATPVAGGGDLRSSPRPTTAGTGMRSMVSMFTVLRHRPGETEAPTPVSQLQLVNSNGQTLATSEMLKTREKIRRQLRFLFIYPLVYIGMWIVPFVSHVMQYDDKYALNPPFGLTCVTTICICSQAAVDCWLFSSREKPWKHIPGANGSFFSSLRFWTGWTAFVKRRANVGPGKTNEEMVREARAAYQRRDNEIAHHRLQAGQTLSASPKKVERSWWESALGGFSPALEVADPMVEAGIANVSSPRLKTPLRPERVHFKEPDEESVIGQQSTSEAASPEGHSSSSSRI
jgi:G protein-coupled receptor GPR1